MEYTFKITPSVRSLSSEGGLDTSVFNGVSLQRTLNVIDVVDSHGNRKQINTVHDGETFDDVISGVMEIDFSDSGSDSDI